VLKLLKDFLKGEYNVVTAARGQEAVAMIPATPVQLLLLDMDLPDLSGLEVFKQMKSTLDARQVKTVGMALRTAQTEVNNARQAGIKDFLYKPFTKTDVEAVFAGLGYDLDPSAPGGARKGFLRTEGPVRILSFPEENDPSLKSFTSALANEIPKELSDMADEGVTQLVIRLTPSVLADLGIVKKFLALLELGDKLALAVRLVAENDRTRDRLRQFSETAEVRTFSSLEQAVGSFD
jgi:CheY-like chemotaxis protein